MDNDDRTVSIVIACHTEDRWQNIVRAIDSASSQHLSPARVIVSVDHNASLERRLRNEFVHITVVANQSKHFGASATRNAGASRVETSLAAFLDDDEVASPDWLRLLVEPFDDLNVVGTGGLYRPMWEIGQPRWFPDEFGWVVGASFPGMPTTISRVRNVWSGNMAVRTSIFRQVGGFREGFGKVRGSSRPEDTDLCIRMAAQAPSGYWIYVPTAVVDHNVPSSRSTLRFFVTRCFAEGAGKAEMSLSIQYADTLGVEREYMRRILPHAIARYLATRTFDGFLRSVAVLAGVAAAGIGATLAWTSRRGGRSIPTASDAVADGASAK